MRCVALLCCVLVTSCSWAFVHAPPAEDPTDPGDCTESRIAPVADVALMTMNLLSLVIASSLCQQRTQGGHDPLGDPAEPCDVEQYVGIGVAGAATLAFGASAVSGFRNTRKCSARRAMDAYRYTAR